MPTDTYLNEAFFKAVEKDLQEYSMDYSGAIERSKMFDIQERERMADLERSYEILEHFGAII